MRLLVLGGTQFLSRAVAQQAVARGWNVTCACRGTSGTLPDGVTHLPWDRNDEAPSAMLDGDWDAVVDVARMPGHVRRAVAAVPNAHWVFISTVNVYADNSSPAMTPLVEPIDDDVDLATNPEAYGPMKVACEQLVTAGAASAAVLRPGLIVGPGDGTGRFTYWPHRFQRGGQVLAPGNPEDVVQVIDVRDHAEWILQLCQDRTTGTFDAVGQVTSMGQVLADVAAGVGASAEVTWVPAQFLVEHGVQPWSGPQGLPLWLPRPDYDGMMSHDPGPAIAAGLALRPVSQTAHDSLQDEPVGLSAQREADVLTAWAESARTSP